MRFSTLKRHIREGFHNVVRNGWMSFASIMAVTVTLFLVGSFVAIILNINQMAHKVEEDVVIKVLIDLTTDEDEIKELKTEIEQTGDIESIRFSSKEDELTELVTGLGEQGEAWQLIEQDNPLNHAYIVKPADPQDSAEIASNIEKLDHIYKVNYGQEVVSKLFTFNKYTRGVGIGMIIALVLVAVFLISNTIKITIMARKTEIGVMKLVGATNSFIRWPFFVEGFLFGVLGSIVPIILISSIYYYLVENVSGKTSFYFVELLPFYPFVYQLSAIIVIFGAIIGMWGSVMSIRKFLRV